MSGLFKSLLLISVLTFTGMQVAQSQGSKHTLAQKYYDAYDFNTALEIYKNILSKKPNNVLALRKAASCCEKLGNYGMAEAYLSALSKTPDKEASDLIAYADLLKINEKYDSALVVYNQYITINPGDSMIIRYIERPFFSTELKEDSGRYQIENSGINTAKSDFGVCILPDNRIMYSSARPEGKGSKRNYSWTDQSYLNIFQSSLSGDSSISPGQVLTSDVNSMYHEGTMAYDDVAKKVYLTRNNYLKSASKSKVGKHNLAIYAADYSGGNLGELSSFPFNNPEYSSGHPAITADGQRLYFVSDMLNGEGGTDIWYCDKRGDGWGRPENAGPKINTAGNEMFPHIQGDQFYFSSDGHVGLGGLDIFSALMTENGFEDINNMGYPLNGSLDDYGLALFEEGNRGYFSSNRPGGSGDDDIYTVWIMKPTTLTISGIALDEKTRLPLDGAQIMLPASEEGGEPQLLGTSNAEGEYLVELPWNKEVELLTLKEGYFPLETFVIDKTYSGELSDVNLELKPFDYAIQGRVLNASTNQPIPGASVYLYDGEGNLIEKETVGSNGFYVFGLQPNSTYSLKGSHPDYLNAKLDVVTSGTEGIVLNEDLLLIPSQVGTVVRLDKIYYDYNKWNIRPDAAIELDRLVNILNDNPTLKIELSSHTDSRGSNSYNKSLSAKRAKSAVDYIISKGVASSRLESKGYGETKLANGCKDGVTCTEEQHQFNRRTEFTILEI